MDMADPCFEGQVVHVSMKATNQDRNREIRAMDGKSIDGWCMKKEREKNEREN